ncbi:zinc ribbon domain-containing protein [Chloroflexota bacterium]
MTQQKEKKEAPFCPYCDSEMIKESVSCCQACGVTMFYCPECRKPLPRDNKVCPHCGTEIRG